MDEENLQRFLGAKGIDAEIIHLGMKTKTVEHVAIALRTSKDKIIKTLTFINGSGEPVLAIITGKDRVNSKKLAEAIDTLSVRMATPSG